MAKRKQEVWYEIKFKDGETVSGPVDGTNTDNLMGHISAKLRRLLIAYNVSDGATITIRVAEAEPDEFARPDPE